MSLVVSGCGWGGADAPVCIPVFFPVGAGLFCSSCLKGWLQALGVGSSSLMVFQWVFVRSDCAPPGGLRSSPRVIYYLSPPPAAPRLRGRCQQRRADGAASRGLPSGGQRAGTGREMHFEEGGNFRSITRLSNIYTVSRAGQRCFLFCVLAIIWHHFHWISWKKQKVNNVRLQTWRLLNRILLHSFQYSLLM